mmetsp:Transcript_35059/g.89684  ORF Transcript_35059/g.89684 Transcript_35059/m.89684 type:complete len:367 (+) Transcript_35059:851-1951(+)
MGAHCAASSGPPLDSAGPGAFMKRTQRFAQGDATATATAASSVRPDQRKTMSIKSRVLSHVPDHNDPKAKPSSQHSSDFMADGDAPSHMAPPEIPTQPAVAGVSGAQHARFHTEGAAVVEPTEGSTLMEQDSPPRPLQPKPCEEESMDKQHSAEHAGNGSEDSQPRSLERHTVESGATAEADSASERGNLNELKRKRPVNSDVAPEEASRSVLQDCNMDTSTAGEGQRGADLKETAKHVKHEDVGTSRWQFGASDAGAGGSASENGAGGDLMDMEPADGIECRLEGTDSVEFVRLSEHCNASSLTSYLRQIFSQKLAEEDCNFGVVYQDASGDWMLLQPGEPWTLVVNVSRRLLVTTKQFVTHSML